MTVLARFTYEVRPGRMADFMKKLAEAASPKFTSAVMPTGVRLYKGSVPGPDTSLVILHIEYEDMAAYEARTAYENGNPEWKKLFEARADSPEKLLSVELLTELQPG